MVSRDLRDQSISAAQMEYQGRQGILLTIACQSKGIIL